MISPKHWRFERPVKLLQKALIYQILLFRTLCLPDHSKVIIDFVTSPRLIAS